MPFTTTFTDRPGGRLPGGDGSGAAFAAGGWTSGPGVAAEVKSATFTFGSLPVANMNVTFQCKLDSAAFKSCASPKKYSRLPGRHTFSVRAVDQDGHKDSTPAKQSFKL
jgi:hypothetical protein